MVYFVGAGPGDVDLITVKGRRLLEQADVVIYAGSLVSEQHLKFCKAECEYHDSASMTLEETDQLIQEAEKQKKMVVRLHTGDPTIFGAIQEQIKCLEKENISFEIVPGVSSFTASCSVLNRQFTLPGVSQTVIVTRMEGKTSVPEAENLESLAAHKCSMAIFLSVQQIDEVVFHLSKGYEDQKVPVAVVYKATWPDQKIVKGTLIDIAGKLKEANINNFAMILVGYFLDTEFERSMLYHPAFTHRFREKTL
ncbi:precorrin-4 C(11)-methyltransferase [Deltaproteobacteria bacterium TL4]